MKRIFAFLLLLSSILSACTGAVPTSEATIEAVQATPDLGVVIYTDPSQPVEARVEDLLKRTEKNRKVVAAWAVLAVWAAAAALAYPLVVRR